MATISLYASKVNGMPGMIRDVKSSVMDLKTEIFNLRVKSLTVNKSICDMDDVISSITAATQVQEDKVEALETFRQNSEQFISDTARVDGNVADRVNENKDDFYDKYYYLKPECEKSGWEKFCDGCAKVGEWCKENWKSLVKIVVAVVIIVALGIATVFTGGTLGVIIAGAFWGALIGGAMGGIIGGITSMISGGSFLEGFADGLLSGTVSGAITGAACSALGLAGQAVGKMVQCGTKLGNAIKITSRVTTVISGVMDGFDAVAMAVGLFNPDSALVKLNQKLHSSVLYNVVQVGVNMLATFTGAASSTMTCFVAGTMILTASGHVAIESIRPGDKVLSTNPDTFEVAEKVVVETYVHENDTLVHLMINGEEIITTETHPFHVSNNGFVEAGKLYPGDELVGINGEIHIVNQVCFKQLEKSVTVYNFHVEGFNTYHVGNACVLVHNSCGTPHQMEGKVFRDGEPVDGVGGNYQSGGDAGCGRLSFQEQLDTHTEAKFLSDIDGVVKPGDHIEMYGSRDPCKPGCQPKIRKFVNEKNVTATYTASDTGMRFDWRKASDNTVIQTITDINTNDVISNYQYSLKANGKWGRNPL